MNASATSFAPKGFNAVVPAASMNPPEPSRIDSAVVCRSPRLVSVVQGRARLK